MMTLSPHIESLMIGLAGIFAVAPENLGTESNQHYMIAAIVALTGTIIYLHKSNQTESKLRAKSEDDRFIAFVSHHEQLIGKIDLERSAMTAERTARIASLMLLIKENAVANEHQASATRELTEMIRERITPFPSSPDQPQIRNQT
jgi:predicted secreted Zn-dependent protease